MDSTGQGETLRVVVPWEPAIEWPSDQRERLAAAKAYNDDRDFAKLSFVAGKRPTVYVTRRLRSSEMCDVDSHDGDPRRFRLAFAYGVREVMTATGETLRPSGARWSDDDMEQFGYAAHCDIGAVALARSRLPLGLRATFALPPSSVAASVAYHFPSAGQSPPAAAQSSSAPEAASASTTTVPERSAESGG